MTVLGKVKRDKTETSGRVTVQGNRHSSSMATAGKA